MTRVRVTTESTQPNVWRMTLAAVEQLIQALQPPRRSHRPDHNLRELLEALPLASGEFCRLVSRWPAELKREAQRAAVVYKRLRR